MNDNELTQVSDLIWSKLNSSENDNKSKEQQIEIIKLVIIDVAQDQQKVGRNQILTHLQAEVNTLKYMSK